MAIATGTGAEVQKPLATTVIGGLIAATILTLLVLPAIAQVVLGSNWQPKIFKRKPESADQPVTHSERDHAKRVQAVAPLHRRVGLLWRPARFRASRRTRSPAEARGGAGAAA